MSGGFEDDPLFDRGVKLCQPLVQRFDAPSRFVTALYEIHRDAEFRCINSEVDVLDPWVHDAENIEKGAEIVDLLYERIFTNKYVLGEPTGTFGILAVIVGIHVLFVRQHGLVVQRLGIRRWPHFRKCLHQCGLAVVASPGQRVFKIDPVSCTCAYHLADANVSRVELGVILYCSNAKERSV